MQPKLDESSALRDDFGAEDSVEEFEIPVTNSQGAISRKHVIVY